MSLLDIPVPVERRGRVVSPLGQWPEGIDPERREAQRLNALKGAAKRPKRTREERLEARRRRRAELRKGCL